MRRRGSLVAVLVAVGAVVVPTAAHAIPAFARKYGVACSACHTNWPRLNRFGINFRDNGYRMNRERDNPVTQGPGYFPLAFRSTVGYEYNSNTLQPVAPTASNLNGLATTTTGTFGFLGLELPEEFRYGPRPDRPDGGDEPRVGPIPPGSDASA